MNDEMRFIWEVEDQGRTHTFVSTIFSVEAEVKAYFLSRFGRAISRAELKAKVPCIDPEPQPVGNGPYWGTVENKGLVRWTVNVKGCAIQQWWDPSATLEEVTQRNAELYGACDGAHRQ